MMKKVLHVQCTSGVACIVEIGTEKSIPLSTDLLCNYICL